MKSRPHLIPALIASSLLFGALAPLPYGYYQMLRWLVFGISIYIAYKGYQWNRKWATWLFAGCAVLFNPILPIYLTREIWRPIDIVFGILFVVSIAVLRKPTGITAVSQQLTENTKVKTAPKYCPKCGYELVEPTNYCPNCGREMV